MDSNQYGINQTCRCCLLNTVDNKSLYERYSSQMRVAEVLTSTTSLKFSDDQDGLPTHICLICFCELHLSYKFVLKCRESDKKLRKTRDTNDGNITSNQINDNTDVKSENDVYDPLFKNLITPINEEHNNERLSLIDKTHFNYELAIVKHVIKLEPEINNINDNPPPVDEVQSKQSSELNQLHQAPSWIENIAAGISESGEKRLNQNGVTNQKRRRFQLPLQENTTETPESDASPKQIDKVNKSHASDQLSVNINHPDEKLSPFRECEKSAHMQSPTREKQYSCTICNKSFTNETDLISHTRVHTDKSSYSCTVCDKSFKNRVNLITHMRKHEKKFPCTLCNESFRVKLNLTVHMQTAH